METNAEIIRKNYLHVKENISNAAERSNRAGSDVKLIVVTKAQPIEKVQAVIEAGADRLGENYPEETLEKAAGLNKYPHIQWHMIGHLQSRKIPLVVGRFDAIHSIDTISLAIKLSRKLVEIGKIMPILIEVNVSGEESKNGFPGWNEGEWPLLVKTIKPILILPGIVLTGLMTMPPYFVDIEQARPYFVKLRNLKDFIQTKLGDDVSLNELSMGTSTDYTVAIEEGATYVRVGQAIMGERVYP